MNIILPYDVKEETFPKVKKDDIIIAPKESEHKGSYYWSDLQAITIERLRRRGLQVEIDKESGGLRVLNAWPLGSDEPAPAPEATIEEGKNDG